MKTSIIKISIAAIISAFPIIVNAAVSPQYAVPEGLYHTDIPQSEMNTINSLFPERGLMNTDFIAAAVDPNVHFVSTGKMSVTFITEGAGNLNKFGYFTYDNNGNILAKGTIFENASGSGYGGGLTTGGILKPGDTIDVGTFTAGTNVGFWLQSNGFKDPKASTFYTIDSMNPDKIRHIAAVETNGNINYGWEDLYGGGDKDYNDLVFRVSVTPNKAIDTSKIPGGSAPGPIVTAALSALISGFFLIRRRIRINKAKVS